MVQVINVFVAFITFTALPDCSYTTLQQDVTVISNDDVLFSRTTADCQRFCDDARAFNCRAFAQKDDRCFLSGDDSVTLGGGVDDSSESAPPLPIDVGSVYKEKICTRSKVSTTPCHPPLGVC